MNDDSEFANKMMEDTIWINPVTSKIEIQPLDTDTDAQLHKERGKSR